jgi:hypothetical protein
MKSGKFRLRKTSNIRQEYPIIYEVVDEDGNVLLDVTKNDSGIYESCILDNQGQGRVIELQTLLELIQEAQRKIELDE